MRTTLRSLLKKLGPGVITGAADDDPSGIATYSQAGAQFGTGMLWIVLFTWPLMASIQIVSAKIGRVSGHGITSNMRRHYSPWLTYAIVSLLLVANTINIAADIAAMGDAMRLLTGGRPHPYAAFFGVLSLVLQIFIPYTRYVRLLKWLTLALLAYIATAFTVRIPWGEALSHTLLPSIVWQKEYITTLVAVFGTTISPYLFFWQASQEVEELAARPHAKPLRDAPRQAESSFRRIKIDTILGMGFSNLVAFFIMLTTAVALHANGIHEINTSAEAAAALRPVAGQFAALLFTLGIVGTGLLAVPVLAGSAAYATAGAFGWNKGLELKPAAAKRFYAIIAIATLLGVALCFTPLDPIKALYWSAVINGAISVPIMAVMMRMAVNPDVMGQFTISRRLSALGWLCTAAMASAVAAMLWLLAA